MLPTGPATGARAAGRQRAAGRSAASRGRGCGLVRHCRDARARADAARCRRSATDPPTPRPPSHVNGMRRSRGRVALATRPQSCVAEVRRVARRCGAAVADARGRGAGLACARATRGALPRRAFPPSCLTARRWDAGDGAANEIQDLPRNAAPMKPLAGHRVLALGEMAGRPLARYLASLGADIIAGQPDAGVTRSRFLPHRCAGSGSSRRRRPCASRHRTHQSAADPRVRHDLRQRRSRGRAGGVASWLPRRWAVSCGSPASRTAPPVKEALDACTFHADMAAAAGAMAAHHSRGTTGRGQHVDVSIQEVAFSRNVNGMLVWQFDRRKLQRVGGALSYGMCSRALHLAARRRLVLPYADDGALRRAGQPGAVGLDG